MKEGEVNFNVLENTLIKQTDSFRFLHAGNYKYSFYCCMNSKPPTRTEISQNMYF